MSEYVSPLIVSLEGRKDLRVKLCRCGECGNEFYLPEFANGEWKPKFCPFCGIQFIRETVADLNVER